MTVVSGGPTRTALYLDFDNVFGTLWGQDQTLALQMAGQPQAWLDRLGSLMPPADRRWLVRRCYMNPVGSVGEGRISFGSLRRAFILAGFELVECAPLKAPTPDGASAKNASDIRMALDIVDDLARDVRYDEFVIASGDSDFTPLVHRIRSRDRRALILATDAVSRALGAAADGVVDIVDALEQPRSAEPAPALPTDRLAISVTETSAPPAGADDPMQVIAAELRTMLDAASLPIPLTSVSPAIRARLQGVAGLDTWFGHVQLSRAIRALRLPGVHVAGQLVWDDARHEPPEGHPRVDGMPPIVQQISECVGLPHLARTDWQEVFGAVVDCMRDADGAADAPQPGRPSAERCAARLGERHLNLEIAQVRTILRQIDADEGTSRTTIVEVADSFVQGCLATAAERGVAPSELERLRVVHWFGARPAAAQQSMEI